MKKKSIQTQIETQHNLAFLKAPLLSRSFLIWEFFCHTKYINPHPILNPVTTFQVKLSPWIAYYLFNNISAWKKFLYFKVWNHKIYNHVLFHEDNFIEKIQSNTSEFVEINKKEVKPTSVVKSLVQVNEIAIRWHKKSKTKKELLLSHSYTYTLLPVFHKGEK